MAFTGQNRYTSKRSIQESGQDPGSEEDVPMTLKDIAKEAGVSISTVSRVIHKSCQNAAGKEVQNRIWEIVRANGYTPNKNAQNLRCGNRESVKPHTGSIACLFSRTADMVNDSFFSPLARSIEQEAFRQNYIVKYSFTAMDIDTPAVYRLVSENQVDGIAILGRCDKDLLAFLKQYVKCVVYTGLNGLDGKCDQIVCNGTEIAVSAVNHLAGLGHRRIAYVGETHHEDRYAGYCRGLKSNNILLRNHLVIDSPISSEGGYAGMKKLLSETKDFTAVFCPNDVTAIGAMKAISEAGLQIPDDISVISIDDIDMAQYFSPMLTTYHIPIEEMGRMTAKILIDRIREGHNLPMTVNLPYYLAKQETCAKPRC